MRSQSKYMNGDMSEKDVLREYLKMFESRGEVDGKVSLTLVSLSRVL